MDSRFLREGNLLKTGDLAETKNHPKGEEFCSLTQHDIRKIHDGDRSYEPIPITEKWLDRYGFKNSGETYDKGLLMCSPDNSGNYTFWYGRFGANEESRLDKEAKYVHELQNLYSGLFGKNLMIEEAK